MKERKELTQEEKIKEELDCLYAEVDHAYKMINFCKQQVWLWAPLLLVMGLTMCALSYYEIVFPPPGILPGTLLLSVAMFFGGNISTGYYLDKVSEYKALINTKHHEQSGTIPYKELT